MLKTLNIKNVGNIKELSVELGKVNVFIGENLAGQSAINDHIFSQNATKLACLRSLLEPVSPEHIEYIKDKMEDWFFPILKDIKPRGDDYGYWWYQSEYDDHWDQDVAVNYVAKSLHSVLDERLGDLVFSGSNFGEYLNPRLARKLLSEMIEISEKNEKQLIIFTQQPNVLDALDLNNDEHRLFTVGFWRDCSCRVIRIAAPKPLEGQEPVRMSEAWLRGYVGGLPKGF